MADWLIEGEYVETCNCSFLCPCITSNLAARPTEGDCKAAIALRIDKGRKDGVSLDGTAFIVVMHAPGAMADGNLTVGLTVDDRASEPQVEAICLVGTAHPVTTWLAIAKATRSSFHAFGIDWDDASGSRNAHFSPFAWSA